MDYDELWCCDEKTKQEVIALYTEKPRKKRGKSKIKQSTLKKILSDINANCAR